MNEQKVSSRRVRPSGKLFVTPTLFAVLAVLILTILGPALTANRAMTGEGNAFRQVSYALVFFYTLWATGALRQREKLMALPLTMALAIGWFWISLIWAIDPLIALRRLLLTTMIVWTIFMMVEEYGYERTVKATMGFLAVMLFLNYAAIALTPSTAIHSAMDSMDKGLIGDWRGLLPQKNFTGAVCALTILFFVFGGQRLNVVLRLLVILAAAYYLYRTQSKTSAGMLGLSVAVGAIYMWLNPRVRVLLIPVVAVVGIGLMMYWIASWDEVLGPFEKRDALTGRVQIWPHLIAYARDHIITGAGYGSFWNIGEASPIYQYSKNWVSEIGNGHNGYIDLLIQVGAPGLILAVVAAFLAPLGKLLADTSASRSRGALLIGIIVFSAGHNMTESSLFDRDVIIQVFLMLAVALTGLVARGSTASPAGAQAKQRVRRRSPVRA